MKKKRKLNGQEDQSPSACTTELHKEDSEETKNEIQKEDSEETKN